MQARIAKTSWKLSAVRRDYRQNPLHRIKVLDNSGVNHRYSPRTLHCRQRSITSDDNKNENMTTPVQTALQVHENDAARLLAATNHDIRTAMNGIAGMLELLADSDLSNAQKTWAATAQRSLDALLALIDPIVDLSLIASGQFSRRLTPFELRHEIQTIVAAKTSHAPDKDVLIVADYPPPTLLLGDPACIRHIVGGMLDSAIMLSSKGAIGVHILLSPAGSNAWRVRITVDVAELADLTANATNATAALCASLARLMGGTFAMDRTERNASAWFEVELPCAPAPLTGVCALLVVDQPARRETLSALLARHGMHVDVRASAVEVPNSLALSAEQGKPYRIAMIDRQMQGMDSALTGVSTLAGQKQSGLMMVLLDDSKCPTAPLPQGFAASIPTLSDDDFVSALIQLFLHDQTIASVSPPSARSHGSARILVADDNPLNQEVAARLLEKLGCTVEIACNGQQATDMHCATPYDLILMDCEMPILDGYQATRGIRMSEGADRHTPIIALTACTTPADRENCANAGMDDFIAKPIRMPILEQTLTRWLRPFPGLPAVAAPAACSDELEAVCNMFGADFAELAMLYQRDAVPRIQAMRAASASGDNARVASIAHAFSGSSVSIGASGLAILCKELEAAAKAGMLDDVDKRVLAIESEYKRICNRLQCMLQ